MTSEDNLVLEVPCHNRRVGEQNLQLRLLREGPVNYALDPYKIRDMWVEARQHDVLFSDYTEGKLEPFIDVLLDPRGVWCEISTKEGQIVGCAYLTNVIPGFDADGHFTLWDAVGSGREPFILYTIEFLMDRYKLHRLTAKIPVYQTGLIRFTERIGFRKEGKIREAVPHKGKWIDLFSFGILRHEVEEQIERIW